ncbi:MAG: hypothetical protein IT371_24625 [Deltaproteobacteria bacterium]|nr:hypothetical protein [Deltaproteobacteria bacterium]
MGRSLSPRLLLLTGLLASSPAAYAGDEPSKATPPEGAAPARKGLSHKYQVGLGVRVGSGYRIVAPYHEEFCGDKDDKGTPKSVCGGMYPFWIEFSPSFGITSSWEVFVDFRLPLATPRFSDARGFFLSPGLKYYTDPDGLFKMFLTFQPVFEFQGQATAGLANFDFGVRSVLGVNFDVLRYLGLYAQAGVILGFTRWLTFTADFGGGIQVRY